MITISDAKDRVVDICTSLGCGLPYDGDSILAETWEELADELAAIARHACTEANRVAAYAGIARRKANEGVES